MKRRWCMGRGTDILIPCDGAAWLHEAYYNEFRKFIFCRWGSFYDKKRQSGRLKAYFYCTIKNWNTQYTIIHRTKTYLPRVPYEESHIRSGFVAYHQGVCRNLWRQNGLFYHLETSREWYSRRNEVVWYYTTDPYTQLPPSKIMESAHVKEGDAGIQKSPILRRNKIENRDLQPVPQPKQWIKHKMLQKVGVKRSGNSHF